MNPEEHEPKKGWTRIFAEVALIAIGFAVVATACGWFIGAKASPINHGVSPDVHDRPLLMLWVLANVPAAILFVGVFSKLGSETQYFLCVFLQLVGSRHPDWVSDGLSAEDI